jgi:hypothetical protein
VLLDQPLELFDGCLHMGVASSGGSALMGAPLLSNGREATLGPLQHPGCLALGDQIRRIIGGMP